MSEWLQVYQYGCAYSTRLSNLSKPARPIRNREIRTHVPKQIESLERAAELMPNDPEVHWRTGVVLRRYGEVELWRFGKEDQ